MMSVNYRHKKTKQEKLLTEARVTCLHSSIYPSATMNAWSEITRGYPHAFNSLFAIAQGLLCALVC
jgi:hypothetical protein